MQKDLLDLNTVVAEAATMARRRMESGQVSLVMSLADALPKIEGDRIELQQVLLSLIVNAIDAIDTVDPGGRRPCGATFYFTVPTVASAIAPARTSAS